MAKARADNADAFAILTNQYGPHIYRLALCITGNPGNAEQVLQETFLQAHRSLDEFPGNSGFYTGVVRIALNESLAKLHKGQGDQTVWFEEPLAIDNNDEPVPHEVKGWAENPEQRYGKAELQKILSEVIQGSEPQFRTVVALRDVEQFSTEEIAEMLGLSVPTVKSLLLRGRLQLRERLNQYFKRSKR